MLREFVEGMNTDNFLVRPHRRTVERFTDPAAWASMSADDAAEAAALAGLPTELPGEDADAKRFDLLALRLQPDLERPGLTQRRKVAVHAVGKAAFVAHFLHQA